MKKNIVTLALLSFIFLMPGFVSSVDDSSDVMSVEVDIFESTVGISVPERVDFGDIAKGYISERQDVDLTNTGTTDIVVTPELTDGTEDIFSYLHFRRILEDPLTRIGFFEVEIERPASIGGERDQNVYMYLDLTNYIGEITEGETDHESEVTFWAMAL